MSAVNMHGNRACFTPECDVHHARLGVQHNGSELARFPCNMTPFILHPRGCNTGQPTYLRKCGTHVGSRRMGQPNPSCTACKTDQNTYRTSRRQPMTYRTNDATTDRARELKNGDRHA